MINPNLIRFWWSGFAGWKTSVMDGISRVDKIYRLPGAQGVDFASNRPSFIVENNRAFMLTSGERRNSIRNNTMAGAVVGAPGTLPTNWSSDLRGFTHSVVAVGTENGVDYIDIQFSGTANTSFTDLQFDVPTATIATTGQTWTQSAWLKVIAQPLPPSSFVFRSQEFTSTGTIVTQVNSAGLPITTSLQRISYTRTLNGGDTVARVRTVLRAIVVNGESYDFTIRIGLPQMEQGSYASPVIKTTTTAITRPASQATITNAIPATGTILLWDDFTNTYEGLLTDAPHRIFESVSTTPDTSLFKSQLTPQRLVLRINSSTNISTPDLTWNALQTRKPWFFALRYDATNVSLWRGDREGNLALVLPPTPHGGATSTALNLGLNSTVTADRATNHLYSDLLTTDEVLTEEQIKAIYFKSLPIFQYGAYTGDNFDRVKQKVYDTDYEVNGTIDEDSATTVRAFYNYDIYSIYEPEARDFFNRVESEGGEILDKDAINTQIIELKNA